MIAPAGQGASGLLILRHPRHGLGQGVTDASVTAK